MCIADASTTMGKHDGLCEAEMHARTSPCSESFRKIWVDILWFHFWLNSGRRYRAMSSET